MSDNSQHLDHLLVNWPFSIGQVLVRLVQGADEREVLQVRVDLGILQLECTGRPDGVKPEGFDSYYDYLVPIALEEGDSFVLDEQQCNEIDREFYQFYHRRICWLTLKRYPEAVADALHTLKLMDFSTAYAPNDEWALLHEQYRPFVMFHKIQAEALVELDRNNPQAAAEAIDNGLNKLAEVFERHDATEHFDEDVFVVKLKEMRASIVKHYEVGPSLAEQLADAIAKEQYELAAELRDHIDHRRNES